MFHTEAHALVIYAKLIQHALDVVSHFLGFFWGGGWDQDMEWNVCDVEMQWLSFINGRVLSRGRLDLVAFHVENLDG